MYEVCVLIRFFEQSIFDISGLHSRFSEWPKKQMPLHYLFLLLAMADSSLLYRVFRCFVVVFEMGCAFD